MTVNRTLVRPLALLLLATACDATEHIAGPDEWREGEDPLGLWEAFDLGSEAEAGPCQPDIKVDEVYVSPRAEGTPLQALPWVELVNRAACDADLTGMQVVNEADAAALAPAVVLAAGERIVLVLAEGDDDPAAGTWFVGDAIGLDPAGGALGVRGDAGALLDFVAWDDPDDGTDPPDGATRAEAVDDGIWPDAEAVPTRYRLGPSTDAIASGHSLARDGNSTDTDVPGDWSKDGESHRPTPRARNKASQRARVTTMGQASPLQRAHIVDPKPWLVLMYVVGDSSLEEEFFGELAQVQRVIHQQQTEHLIQDGDLDMRVVAQFDTKTIGTDVAQTANVGDTFRGELLGSSDEDVLTFFAPEGAAASDLGEVDMADPQSLSAFLAWATANYEASHTALVLAGHGLGWRGTLLDDTSHTQMQIGELDTALQGHEFDAIVFESCLMSSVEVAYQLREHAAAIAAPQVATTALAFDWDIILAEAEGAADGPAFATAVTRAAQDSMGSWTFPYSLTAIRTDALQKLYDDIETFAKDMAPSQERSPNRVGGLDDWGMGYQSGDTSKLDNVQRLVGDALLASTHMGIHAGTASDVDLCDFFTRIDEEGGILPAYKKHAATVCGSARAAVLREVHGNTKGSYSGLNIYFPTAQDRPADDRRAGSRRTDVHEDGLDHEFDAPDAYADHTGGEDNEVKYGADGEPDCGMDEPDEPTENAPGFDFAANHWRLFLHRFFEPVAHADCTPAVFQGGWVFCDGSGSSGFDEEVVHWSWDFAPGINADADDLDDDCRDELDDDSDATGETLLRLLPWPGEYPLVLTVWNALAGCNECTYPNEWFETDQDATIVRVYGWTKYMMDLFTSYTMGEVTFTVPNPYGTPLTGVTIVDAFTPGELIYVAAEDELGEEVAALDESEDGQVSFGPFDIPAGEELVFVVSYSVQADVDGDGNVVSSAYVSADGIAGGRIDTTTTLQPLVIDPSPWEPTPVTPGPFEPGPFEPGPFEPGPFEPGPFEPRPLDPGALDPVPFDPAPWPYPLP